MVDGGLWSLMQRQWKTRKLTRLEPGLPVGLADVLWTGGEGWHKTGFIELKADVNVVRPGQAIFLRQIGRAGGSAFVLSRYRSAFHLVPWTAITLEAEIRYDDALRRWEGAIDWSELEELVAQRSGV